MDKYPQALDHTSIKEILPNIFIVTGKSIFIYQENEIQKSNNMIIVRNGSELTLINTLRLNETGLKKLDSLGKVTHVIRIGAFHDRNDLFYIDKYKAKLWALEGMIHKDNLKADFIIQTAKLAPFVDASFFFFETTSFPEAILHINREGGILITCDSIKNWIKADSFFSKKTAKDFMDQGLIAAANIDPIWLAAMKPQKSDFLKLKELSFKHLISAHGEPIIDNAFEQVMPKINKLAK